MRPIKFRVWYIPESRFIETPYGLFFKYPHNTMGEYIGDFIRDTTVYLTEQFTGLKDKTGRDIYEGDIVVFDTKGHVHGPESDSFKGLVEWNEEYGCWMFADGSYSLFDRINLETLEVIGNAHQNPELLK